MVTEYLLLLMISIVILGASFGLSGGGPIEMFQKKTPVLAYQIEENLETGSAFRDTEWQD